MTTDVRTLYYYHLRDCMRRAGGGFAEQSSRISNMLRSGSIDTEYAISMLETLRKVLDYTDIEIDTTMEWVEKVAF